jgi:hypothetical protein
MKCPKMFKQEGKITICFALKNIFVLLFENATFRRLRFFVSRWNLIRWAQQEELPSVTGHHQQHQ